MRHIFPRATRLLSGKGVGVGRGTPLFLAQKEKRGGFVKSTEDGHRKKTAIFFSRFLGFFVAEKNIFRRRKKTFFADKTWPLPWHPFLETKKENCDQKFPPPPQKCSWPFFDVDFTVRIRPFIVMTKRIFPLDFASYCAHFGVSLCDETTCLTKFVALVRTTQRIETSQKSSDRTCHHHQRHHRNPIPIPYPYF